MRLPEPPDPPLGDGVVTLRPWTRDDVPALVECCADAEIGRWIDLVPQPYTEGDGRTYVEQNEQGWRDGTSSSFAVTDAADSRVLGSVAIAWSPWEDPLRAGVGEVGYWTRADARGRGVTTRAVALVSHWALAQPGVSRLQLRADVQNEPSRRVAEKAGFRLEGVLRSAQWSPRQQRRYDFAMYSLLPRDLHRAATSA